MPTRRVPGHAHLWTPSWRISRHALIGGAVAGVAAIALTPIIVRSVTEDEIASAE